MNIESKISRRDFLGVLGRGVIVAGAVSAFPSLAYSKNHKETERNVEKILGFDVEVDGFNVLRNGGEVVFDIKSPKNFKGDIGFSESYLNRNLKSAKEDLLKMYNLKKENEGLDKVSLWNAHFRENDIIRNAEVGYSSIPLESDWNTIFNGKGILANNKEILCESFYLPFPSRTLDEKLIRYVKNLGENPLKYKIKELWDFDIDTFQTEAEKKWILKGRSSTMLYSPKEEKFYVGGVWDRDTKIEKIYEENRQLLLDEKGTQWLLQIIDTDSNITGSAYKAFRY